MLELFAVNVENYRQALLRKEFCVFIGNYMRTIPEMKFTTTDRRNKLADGSNGAIMVCFGFGVVIHICVKSCLPR